MAESDRKADLWPSYRIYMCKSLWPLLGGGYGGSPIQVA